MTRYLSRLISRAAGSQTPHSLDPFIRPWVGTNKQEGDEPFDTTDQANVNPSAAFAQPRPAELSRGPSGTAGIETNTPAGLAQSAFQGNRRDTAATSHPIPSPEHSTGPHEPVAQAGPGEWIRDFREYPALRDGFAEITRKPASRTEEAVTSSTVVPAIPESAPTPAFTGETPEIRQHPEQPYYTDRNFPESKYARPEERRSATDPDRQPEAEFHAPELSPRAPVSILGLGQNPERDNSEPRLFIGHLSVEVVPSAPAGLKPVPHRQALSRPAKPQQAGITERRAKGRFGLGQV